MGSVGIIQTFDLPTLFQGVSPPQLQLLGRYRRQETAGDDYTGNVFNAAAGLVVPLPWRLQADFTANFGWERYDNPNSIDQNNRRRRDFEADFSVGVSREINQWLTIRGEYEYTNHESNLITDDLENPYEFSRHIVGVKMVFTF
jgi:hypothetical protein